MEQHVASLLAIAVLAVLAPLASRAIGRLVRVPVVVFELALGILAGPSLLNLIQPGEVVSTLSEFGLALLFFVAGTEIQASALRGRTGQRAWMGWFVSVIAGVAVGWLLVPGEPAVIIGIALTSTALGTLLPILRDAGEMKTPFGKAVSALGTVGEFGPLIAISVFLGGRNPGVATLVLLLFAVIAGFAVWFAMRVPKGRLHEIVSATLHTSGQFAVRAMFLIIAVLVALSIVLQIDLLLGAFTAGVVWRLAMREAAESDQKAVESKVEGIAFGFFVPIFFIYTGVTFDLQALIDDPGLLAYVALALLAMLVVRGIPSTIVAEPGATLRERASLLLMGSTGLPIIVAVTSIGVSEKILTTAHAAILVGAGMLSVLIFPLVAMGLRGESPRQIGPFPQDDDVA
ncbi:cation:proton antiporter [Microbacterium thalassium]|uniref:Kef-type K+ transport system membrane component KefB n=1 Tax=Microbacterium thalassium TaxID=362649 RepID=A0A7X0FNR8_9MICO|nr:cation:proton antiporter [Microbacterium thalassium]MBB6390927.1 Kef-type K+ transport system membrane component KefB [Microbacterium thalassium]GLK26035.1 sodium/hydrogen exchanger [Microbacterium thalassium]